MPPDESDGSEFLCPYFDGSKLILPPGYEELKKNDELTDELDDMPLTARRSKRVKQQKKKKSTPKPVQPVAAPGVPVPTCMFVNAGVSGGNIEDNKNVFEKLVDNKGPAAADESFEFTIEVNEESDDEGGKDVINIPDDEEEDGSKSPLKISNVMSMKGNLPNGEPDGKSSSDADATDVKLKDDPIFLSDEDDTKTDSSKPGEKSASGQENDKKDVESSHEKSLEKKPESEQSENTDKKDDEVEKAGDEAEKKNEDTTETENATCCETVENKEKVQENTDSPHEAEEPSMSEEKADEQTEAKDDSGPEKMQTDESDAEKNAAESAEADPVSKENREQENKEENEEKPSDLPMDTNDKSNADSKERESLAQPDEATENEAGNSLHNHESAKDTINETENKEKIETSEVNLNRDTEESLQNNCPELVEGGEASETNSKDLDSNTGQCKSAPMENNLGDHRANDDMQTDCSKEINPPTINDNDTTTVSIDKDKETDKNGEPNGNENIAQTDGVVDHEKISSARSTPKPDDLKSDADSEKTEDDDLVDPVILELKRKMKDYCIEKVAYKDCIEISGSLTITADTDRCIRGNIGQKIAIDEAHPGNYILFWVMIGHDILILKIC